MILNSEEFFFWWMVMQGIWRQIQNFFYSLLPEYSWNCPFLLDVSKLAGWATLLNSVCKYWDFSPRFHKNDQQLFKLCVFSNLFQIPFVNGNNNTYFKNCVKTFLLYYLQHPLISPSDKTENEFFKVQLNLAQTDLPLT